MRYCQYAKVHKATLGSVSVPCNNTVHKLRRTTHGLMISLKKYFHYHWEKDNSCGTKARYIYLYRENRVFNLNLLTHIFMLNRNYLDISNAALNSASK